MIPRRSAHTARSTSWWPFSHTSLPGEIEWISFACTGGFDGGEAVEIDSGSADADALRRDALEKEADSCPLGRREEEIGGPEHTPPVRTGEGVTKGVTERQRLPDRGHEANAKAITRPGRLSREPCVQLRDVHDRCPRQRSIESEVAVHRQPCDELGSAASGDQVADRAGADAPYSQSRRTGDGGAAPPR
jgi:hypothetical protein